MANPFTVDISIKKFFFDRPEVLKRLKKKKLKALRSAGALSRKVARNSLRRRKRRSLPGETPSVHTKSRFASLKNILFGLDPTREETIVGPVKIPGGGDPGQTTPTPGVLEYGAVMRDKNRRRKIRKLGQVGEVAIEGHPQYDTQRKDGTLVSRGRFAKWKGSKVKTFDEREETVHYGILKSPAMVARANAINELLYGPEDFGAQKIEPRPFMRPALEVASKDFVELYVKEGS